MLLQHHFESTAERLGGKTALVCGAQRVTYAELHGRVLGLTAQLRQEGVQAGDRVVLLLESSADYAVALHAVLQCGAVIAPLPPTTKVDKLAFVIEDLQARALLLDTRHPAAALAMNERCPSLRTLLTNAAFARSTTRAVASAEIIDQDLAAIIYTSGSTGRPKGVMLTHRNMLSAWASVQAYLGLREDDVIALALPPTFSYGLYHLLMGLGLGATVVLERQAAFPRKLAETLQRERATVLPAVPTLFANLLSLPQLGHFDHGTLRLVTNAAAALPTTQIPRIGAAWPAARLFSMYGMTECKRISYLPPGELERRPASVGRGMPNQEHWLFDEAGRRLPNGATGELVVRGGHVMRGYWRRPAETTERLRPGPLEGERVLHTGDLFRTDNDGYLYFLARQDDIIKTRGEKVAPREVEEALHTLPGIAACAVVGVPDPLLGEAVKAFVTLVAGSTLSARDIVRHCQGRLESHMVPKSVEFCAELPITESGKVRHAALRVR